MANSKDNELRILLPLGPDDDLGEVTRLLKALVPAQPSHARRVYVHRPVESDFFISETYARLPEINQLEFDAENATRVATAQAMSGLAAEGFKVSAEVIRGTPTEEMLREASLWRADFIAVRTRSAAAEDDRIGGMASALLHHASCPVLTYPAVPEAYRVRRILIPTDFSKASRASVDWGLTLATITGAEAVLLHVVADWADRHGIERADLAAMASEELERWRVAAPPALSRPILATRIVVDSTPARGILLFSRAYGADLIVVSAKGGSAVRAILLGSNTRKVVRRSLRPVLVIPDSNRVEAEDFLKRAGASESRGNVTAGMALTGAVRRGGEEGHVS